MKRLVLSLAFASLIPAHIATAGSPTQVDFTCPIGGEIFEITETLSCSNGGRYMSFRLETTCDFVTRLPICPSNDFPVYKNFSPEEVEKLEAFVETGRYAELTQLPPWQRAYSIAEFLEETASTVGFGLQLNAFWYETEHMLQSEIARANFHREVSLEIGRATVEDRPYLDAIESYFYLLEGETEQALPRLQALKAQGALPEYLLHYVDQLLDCSTRIEDQDCGPWAQFVVD